MPCCTRHFISFRQQILHVLHTLYKTLVLSNPSVNSKRAGKESVISAVLGGFFSEGFHVSRSVYMQVYFFFGNDYVTVTRLIKAQWHPTAMLCSSSLHTLELHSVNFRLIESFRITVIAIVNGCDTTFALSSRAVRRSIHPSQRHCAVFIHCGNL